MIRLTLSVFFFLFIILSATSAYAYLDPGTGSMILQGILGAIAAIAVVTRLYWYRILRVFGFSKNNSSNEEESEKNQR